MFSNKLTSNIAVAIAMVITLAIGSKETIAKTTQATQSQAIVLEVYKSPACNCCKNWISHINKNGIKSEVYHRGDISVIKNKKGIEPSYRSCHTAISKNGYVFEGHIPTKFIQQFLDERHADDVIGLSVPGMKMGTPGMEVGDKFMPYQILLLKNEGASELYVAVNSSKGQY